MIITAQNLSTDTKAKISKLQNVIFKLEASCELLNDMPEMDPYVNEMLSMIESIRVDIDMLWE